MPPRLLQATISQESAAEEPPATALRVLELPGLDGEEGGSMAGAPPPKSVDDVLGEIDAALAAAEAGLEKGRSPSPPAWASPSLGHGGSSGSVAANGASPSPSPSASAASVAAARPAAARATHLSSLR